MFVVSAARYSIVVVRSMMVLGFFVSQEGSLRLGSYPPYDTVLTLSTVLWWIRRRGSKKNAHVTANDPLSLHRPENAPDSSASTAAPAQRTSV